MAFIRTALQAIDCAGKTDNRSLLSGKFCWADMFFLFVQSRGGQLFSLLRATLGFRSLDL